MIECSTSSFNEVNSFTAKFPVLKTKVYLFIPSLMSLTEDTESCELSRQTEHKVNFRCGVIIRSRRNFGGDDMSAQVENTSQIKKE